MLRAATEQSVSVHTHVCVCVWFLYPGTLNCALGINSAFVLGHFYSHLSDLFRMFVHILNSSFDLLCFFYGVANKQEGGASLRVWGLNLDAVSLYPENFYIILFR